MITWLSIEPTSIGYSNFMRLKPKERPMFLSFLLSSLVHASDLFTPEPIPEYWQLPEQSLQLDWSHGPDKPPPDDGYTFKIKKTVARGWPSLALSCCVPVASLQCSMVRAPEGSDLRQKRMVRASALGASGIGLVLVIRLR